MYLRASNPTLTSISFSGNMAIEGGGMFIKYSNPTLTDVTFTNNLAENDGGGMSISASNTTIINSILWGNSPQEIYFSLGLGANSTELTISYSDIQDGEAGIVTNGNGTVYWGDGNIDDYPLFCDPDNGDFTLASNSPCIDTGEDGANMGALGIGCPEIIIVGCTDDTACNYDATANTDDGSCEYISEGKCDCDGNDNDECGVCGGDGYVDWECNDGSSTCWNIADGECDCDGNVLDECNVCGGDNSTCTGCMEEDACNYDATATESGDCIHTDGICETCLDGVIVDNDSDDDTVCDADEIVGCQDDTACNYDETATDSGDCIYINGICETCVDGEIVDNDSDDDTVCDDMDVCEGYDDTVDSDGDGTPDGCDLSIYEGIIPDNFSIASIYPNPFNPVTSITYGLPENTDIQIKVYDMGGTHITTLENTFQTAGYHTINWNASSFPSGVYLIRMDSGDFTQTQKVVLVK